MILLYRYHQRRENICKSSRKIVLFSVVAVAVVVARFALKIGFTFLSAEETVLFCFFFSFRVVHSLIRERVTRKGVYFVFQLSFSPAAFK